MSNHCWQCRAPEYDEDRSYRLSFGNKDNNRLLGFYCSRECLSTFLADSWDALLKMEEA